MLAQDYTNSIRDIPSLNAESNNDLFVKYNSASGDKKKYYRNKLIEGNMGLVMKIAQNYAKSCKFLSFQDLCQEGAIGLSVAIEKYDIGLNNAFSTYAYQWIESYIRRSILKYEQLIYKPVYLIKTEKEIREIIENAKKNNKPIPSCKELAKRVKQSEETVASILNTFSVVYADAPVNDEPEAMTFFDTLASDINIEEKVCFNEEINEILKYLKNTIKNEKTLNIFLYRSGLEDGVVHTLEETGKKFSVAKEWVRMTERRVYKKLQDHFLNNIKFLKTYGHRKKYVKTHEK